MAYTLCYASGGGLKTRIMANIQTPIRLINVKETYEEAQDSCLRKLIEIVNQNKDESKENKKRV